MGERSGSPAPDASRKNDKKRAEVCTAVSTQMVAVHFCLADGPSPSSGGSRLLVIGERRIMGNGCLSTALTAAAADQGHHPRWLLQVSCLAYGFLGSIC